MTLSKRTPLPSVIQKTSDRETNMLRVLGRFGPTRLSDLASLVLVGLADRTIQRFTRRLLERGLIWETRTAGEPSIRADGRPGPPRSQRVVGLTIEGKNLLDAIGADDALTTLERFVVRDRRAPAPSLSTLMGDVLISAWCTAVLDQARRAPMLIGARCYSKLVTAVDQKTGQPLQQVGAYLELIFDPEQRSYQRPGWQIPWFDIPTPQGCHVVRFLLEVDTGRQAIPLIIRQVHTYAGLMKNGTYGKVFGGMPLPVILTPPGQRAQEVRKAWRDAWPETPAVLASTTKAEHAEYGALWGSYSTIKDSPPKPTYLLGGLVQSPETWGQITLKWQP